MVFVKQPRASPWSAKYVFIFIDQAIRYVSSLRKQLQLQQLQLQLQLQLLQLRQDDIPVQLRDGREVLMLQSHVCVIWFSICATF